MSERIGISDDKLRHIIGVARKAYQIALEKGEDETFARHMFLLGWLHDIGYEFAERSSDHPQIGADMIAELDGHSNSPGWFAVLNHGRPVPEITDEWAILVAADMQVDSHGNELSIIDRLRDIKSRYGADSRQYLSSCESCFRIGLTPRNMANEL